MRNHMLTSHGMCVVSIDSRGSDNRGVAFQSHIKNRMGTVEIADQVGLFHGYYNLVSIVMLLLLHVM